MKKNSKLFLLIFSILFIISMVFLIANKQSETVNKGTLSELKGHEFFADKNFNHLNVNRTSTDPAQRNTLYSNVHDKSNDILNYLNTMNYEKISKPIVDNNYAGIYNLLFSSDDNSMVLIHVYSDNCIKLLVTNDDDETYNNSYYKVTNGKIDSAKIEKLFK